MPCLYSSPGLFRSWRLTALRLCSLGLCGAVCTLQAAPPIFQASAPSARVNATLKADQSRALIEFNGWYQLDVGNAPTVYTRRVINLFSLVAANVIQNEGGELAWRSKDVPVQAEKFLDYSSLEIYTGVDIRGLFRRKHLTPATVGKIARNIIAASGKGFEAFWHLPNKAEIKREVAARKAALRPGQRLYRDMSYRREIAVAPGKRKVRRVTAYSRNDLETLMKYQVEAAKAFLDAAAKIQQSAVKE